MEGSNMGGYSQTVLSHTYLQHDRHLLRGVPLQECRGNHPLHSLEQQGVQVSVPLCFTVRRSDMDRLLAHTHPD